MFDRVVYETPDGGNTVYARDLDTGERRLHSVSEKKARLDAAQKQDQIWEEIRRGAAYDPELRNMLDQVLIYWNLKKK